MSPIARGAAAWPMPSRRGVVTSLLALPFAGVVAGPARAELHIDITRGKIEPMPIAITTFTGTKPDEGRVGHAVSEGISGNVERSGLFKPIDPKSFIQTAESLKVQPRFADWRGLTCAHAVRP